MDTISFPRDPAAVSAAIVMSRDHTHRQSVSSWLSSMCFPMESQTPGGNMPGEQMAAPN